MKRKPAWTRSNTEEVLAALYLVAGNTAYIAGIHWLAWLCFGKAALDTLAALIIAERELNAPKP